MDKSTLRKDCRKKRAAVADKLQTDKAISDAILSSKEYISCEKILLFASIGSEFDTQQILLQSIKDKKHVYFPKCEADGIMKFYEVKSPADLSSGYMHVPEPVKSNIVYELKSPSDLLLVPALCADKSFNRLGYGGGFYDRFLKIFKGVSICPVYSSLLFDEIGTDSFDMPVDIIYTENGRLEKE